MGLRRPRGLGHFRRTACTGLVVVGAVTAAAGIGAPAALGQAAGFNKGTGTAVAESIRFDPVAGGLSFGVGIGEALAGHQNAAATAESRSANLGVIGTTAAGEGCDGGDPTLPEEDQPQPLRVESGEEGAAEGKSGQDPKVPGVDRQVRANTNPFAEAITTGSNTVVPGVMEINGARALASSGVEGEQREAIARTEIGRIAFIAGQVEMRDMVWEAIHRSGTVNEQIATFSIGAMTIAGQPVPVDDPTAALASANDALALVGLQIRPPRAHFDETARGTLATVDPMGIRVVPAPARDGILGPVLGGVQPAREELFQALIDMDCGNSTFITVLDIVLNAFGAGGYFAVELGGVQASTNEITRFSGLGALGAGGNLPPLTGALPSSGVSTATPGGSTSSGSTSSGSTATPAAPAATETAAAPEQPIDDAVDAVAEGGGERGGALAAVAAGGLFLLAAVAEGDRRKMRRAMREIPLEA